MEESLKRGRLTLIIYIKSYFASSFKEVSLISFTPTIRIRHKYFLKMLWVQLGRNKI